MLAYTREEKPIAVPFTQNGTSYLDAGRLVDHAGRSVVLSSLDYFPAPIPNLAPARIAALHAARGGLFRDKFAKEWLIGVGERIG